MLNTSDNIVIGVDLDGVVFDFIRDFVDFYNARFGYNDDPKDVIKWNWWECPNLSITFEQFIQAMGEFTRLRMWRDMTIYPDVKSNLCSISLSGADIIYITCRPRESRRSTARSILSNGLPLDGIEFLDHEEKAEFAKLRGINIVIEDKVETVLDYISVGLETYFKIDQHNNDRWENIKIHRIDKDYTERVVTDEMFSHIHPVNSFREFADKIRNKLKCEGQTDHSG